MLIETIIDIEKEIDDDKEYICNGEVYEGLILKFNIEYTTCAVCQNLPELNEIDSICRNCGQGNKFKLNEYKQVTNEKTDK